jgi:hypothetical protein
LKKRLGETSYPPEVPSGKRLVVRSTGSGKPQQSQKPPSHVAVIPADSINIYEEIAEILERRGWPKSPHR